MHTPCVNIRRVDLDVYRARVDCKVTRVTDNVTEWRHYGPCQGNIEEIVDVRVGVLSSPYPPHTDLGSIKQGGVYAYLNLSSVPQLWKTSIQLLVYLARVRVGIVQKKHPFYGLP